MSRRNSVYHNVHCHTEYSILDGVGKVDEYAQIALKSGMGYLCATDHGMAAAWPTLLSVCEETGLRPVFGAELYVNDWHHLVPRFSELTDDQKILARKNNHVLLFAETEQGFENLLRLSTLGWDKGFYYKPRVSTQQIQEYSEGLIATSACLASPINQELLKGDRKAAQKILRHWANIFPGRYWVEWQLNNVPGQDKCNAELIAMAEEEGLPTLVANDVHYADRGDYLAQCIQLAMRKGTVADIAKLRLRKGAPPEEVAADLGIAPKRMDQIVAEVRAKRQGCMDGESEREEVFQLDTNELWFVTEDEIDDRWYANHRRQIPEKVFEDAKLQTLRLCQRCGYVEPDRSLKLPSVPDADEKLLRLTYDGLKAIGKHRDPAYRSRVEYEFHMIAEKGFSGYFIVQHDLIEAVRREFNVEIGPGRGSVGGCLIAYAIGITEIDPIVHGTLFERFLTPSRGGRLMQCSLH